MKTVSELLSWIIYSGGGILVASWALERIRRFQTQPPEGKKAIVLTVSVALALAAYAILTYVPSAILAQVDPWLTVAAGTVLLYSGGQVYHKLTKNSGPGPAS